MSSGRSGAPSGRSGPEQSPGPSVDPWGQPQQAETAARPASRPVSRATSGASGAASHPLSDLPALPYDSLPPMDRAPFNASECGQFGLGAGSGGAGAPLPGTGTARPTGSMPRASLPFDPFGDQISGPAAAELFGQTARRSALPSFDAASLAGEMSASSTASQAGQPTSARLTAAPDLAAMGGAPAISLDTLEQSAEQGHQQTLTQQMRSMQPPDVARQALNELSVLAGELISLARELEQSGLARMHERAYFDTVRRYSELARLAWLSVAAERLEQDGASSDYRQLVVDIARDITRLRRESVVAASNEQFPLPRRRPYLWRSRAAAIHRGLAAWQTALVAPVDSQRMGVALFELRGALNTANVAPLEYSLLTLLTGAALTLTPLGGLAAGLASIASAFTNHPLVAASFTLVTLLTFMLWAILLLLTLRGRVTLIETLAGTCFSATRSACNGRSGSTFAAVTLRAWWLLIGGAGALLTLAALVGSGFALVQLPMLAPLTQGLAQAPLAGLWQTAGLLAVIAAPAALVATAALVALALPTLLLNAIRLAGEMAGSRRWVPAARRYALGPALATLTYLTGALVALAWLLADHLGLAQMTLAHSALMGGSLHFIISERAPLLALALTVPYLILIELPFRLGLGSWRRVWLRDLRARRATVEAHVRRLSAPDPRTGVPDTGDETLRALQYDLVLLQFYTARIEEAERASASPLGLGGTLAMLVIIVAGALLLDGSAQALAQALTVRLTP